MKSSGLLAGFVALLAVLWIGSGVLGIGRPEEPLPSGAESSAQARPLPAVRIRESVASPVGGEIVVAGRSLATRSATLSAQIEGAILERPAGRGMSVREGDVLARIAPEARPARVQEAQERVTQMDIAFQAARSLETQGFNSRIGLAQARADLESARADLARAQVDLEHTEIKAPFDGVLSDHFIDVGDSVRPGDSLFSILAPDPMKVTVFVTEQRLPQITLGSPAHVRFLDGQSIEADVVYIAPSATPQSRTFRVDVAFPNPSGSIREGVTGEVRIPTAPYPAHDIPASILSLTDSGRVGVKILDPEDRILFVPVHVLRDSPSGLWVTGLPERVRIVTVGQEFVLEGQTVKAVPETSGAEPQPKQEPDDALSGD